MRDGFRLSWFNHRWSDHAWGLQGGHTAIWRILLLQERLIELMEDALTRP